MKLMDIIQKSESFSFFVNTAELAEKVAIELQKHGYEYKDPEMCNIFDECVRGRASKYLFEIRPKAKHLCVQPNFGSSSTDINSFENPIFSQDIMVFILWILRNEGSI